MNLVICNVQMKILSSFKSFTVPSTSTGKSNCNSVVHHGKLSGQTLDSTSNGKSSIFLKLLLQSGALFLLLLLIFFFLTPLRHKIIYHWTVDTGFTIRINWMAYSIDGINTNWSLFFPWFLPPMKWKLCQNSASWWKQVATFSWDSINKAVAAI